MNKLIIRWQYITFPSQLWQHQCNFTGKQMSSCSCTTCFQRKQKHGSQETNQSKYPPIPWQPHTYITRPQASPSTPPHTHNIWLSCNATGWGNSAHRQPEDRNKQPLCQCHLSIKTTTPTWASHGKGGGDSIQSLEDPSKLTLASGFGLKLQR